MTTPRESFSDEEEDTRGGVPRRVVRAVPTLSPDLHEAMGQIMREVVSQGRRVDELTGQVAGFENVLLAAIAKQERDRPSLVHTASKTSAQHTSNRMAALLGALFLLYTEAAPYLHELWKMVHR